MLRRAASALRRWPLRIRSRRFGAFECAFLRKRHGQITGNSNLRNLYTIHGAYHMPLPSRPTITEKYLRSITSRLIVPATAFIFLVGCMDESVYISLSGLNYTDDYIADFTVNGHSGANIQDNGGGGSFVCCVAIPNRWREDLSVTVRWVHSSTHSGPYKEKTVKIPPYADGDFGTLVVHFYPDDNVRVLVTTKTSEHPAYPYPRPIREQRETTPTL